MKIKHFQGRCCQHNLLHFCLGHPCCCVPLAELKLSEPCCRGNAKKVTHLTAHTVNARCWEMTSIFTWVICWRGLVGAPVFSVDSCWDTFPHLCIAVHSYVLAPNWFTGEEIRWKTMSSLCFLLKKRADEDAYLSWVEMSFFTAGSLKDWISHDLFWRLCSFYSLTTYGIWLSSHNPWNFPEYEYGVSFLLCIFFSSFFHAFWCLSNPPSVCNNDIMGQYGRYGKTIVFKV